MLLLLVCISVVGEICLWLFGTEFCALACCRILFSDLNKTTISKQKHQKKLNFLLSDDPENPGVTNDYNKARDNESDYK